MNISDFSKALPSDPDAYTAFDIPDQWLPVLEDTYLAPAFLAPGESLRDVCAADLTALEKYGTSCDAISDALEDLVDQAKRASVAGFKVTHCKAALGEEQECPFSFGEGACHVGGGVCTIENLTSRKKLSFPLLLIDTIRYHAFFGAGQNRLDPEAVCSVLGILPDVGIKKRKVEEPVWQLTAYDTSFAAPLSKELYIIDESTTAYLVQEGKKRVCYIVNRSERSSPFFSAIDGVRLSSPVQAKGRYIFEMESRVVAKIVERSRMV